MKHSFSDLIGLASDEQGPGSSRCSLLVRADLLNPHRVLHGAALYALADTGMGAALYPLLEPGDMCATVEIKISYFKPVTEGVVSCVTTLVNRGKRLANLESRSHCGEVLVAQANGNYAIFRPSNSRKV